MQNPRRLAVLTLAAWPLALRAAAEGTAQRAVDVAPFTAIEVGGDVPLELVQRQPPRVLVDADADAQPLVEVTSEGGVLQVRRRGRVLPGRLRIVVQVWALERIDVSGSAAISAGELAARQLVIQATGSSVVRLDKLTAEVLRVQGGGSASLRVAGQANELDAALGGSCALQAPEFKVRRIGVKLGGSAAARVWAVDTLDGAVGGSAQLRYRGEPRVEVARGGSAAVTRL